MEAARVPFWLVEASILGSGGGGSGYVTSSALGRSTRRASESGNGLVLISPPGPPAAPGSVSAIPGKSAATVSWASGWDVGRPITGYVVTPYLAGVAQAPSHIPISCHIPGRAGLEERSRLHVHGRRDQRPGHRSAIDPEQSGRRRIAHRTSQPVGDRGQRVRDRQVEGARKANGSPVTGYVITPYLAGHALKARRFNSKATTETVRGLKNGKRYRFTVAAINKRGTGPKSATSPSSLARQPRRAMSKQERKRSAKIHWTAPANNNGSPIRNYVVTAYGELNGVGGIDRMTVRPSARSSVLNYLTPCCTSYRFTVAARNGRGLGAASPKTPPVAP